MTRKMPNRADHSVKTRRRERAPTIKSLVVAGGAVCAVLGALIAMFAGGPDGLIVGSGVLTTVIFLQIFLWLQMQYAPEQRDESPISEFGVGGSARDLSDVPILILDVSEHGRVRSIVGQTRLLPTVRIGSDVSRLLGDHLYLSVSRVPGTDGTWIVILPQQAEGAAENTDLMERTNFFAGLGHDLKSPLNAVIGFSEIMESEIRGPMPDAYKDYPGLIRDSGQTLLRLVEDMLAYARSEAGTYELDIAPLDIAASGESVLRQSQAMASKADVTLRLAARGEVIAMADADAVRRIWDNLVSNAIKYSNPGETVTLTAVSSGSSCILQVSDTGAGMDADDLARIAKPFAQGRNAKGRAGTGLGLAMVQRLAEMQNGQVEIRTAPGAGTTVIVKLPAHATIEKRAAE